MKVLPEIGSILGVFTKKWVFSKKSSSGRIYPIWRILPRVFLANPPKSEINIERFSYEIFLIRACFLTT